MRDGGFLVARGERGLVLVPADGTGKPVGAARKARLIESAMRALLGDEIGRLPEISRTADLKTWLASHKASYDVRTLSGDDVKTEQPEHVETNSLAGPGPGGHRDGTVSAETLRVVDSKGMLPATFAMIHAATAADSLLPLRELLEPPEGESKLQQVIDLLTAIAESQIRIERRLVAIESRTVKPKESSDGSTRASSHR